MNGSLSAHVEHFLMGMGVILNSWAHANDNSPRGVGSEDEHRVVNSAKLRVNNSVHFKPLIEFN